MQKIDEKAMKETKNKSPQETKKNYLAEFQALPWSECLSQADVQRLRAFSWHKTTDFHLLGTYSAR